MDVLSHQTAVFLRHFDLQWCSKMKGKNIIITVYIRNVKVGRIIWNVWTNLIPRMQCLPTSIIPETVLVYLL